MFFWTFWTTTIFLKPQSLNLRFALHLHQKNPITKKLVWLFFGNFLRMNEMSRTLWDFCKIACCSTAAFRIQASFSSLDSAFHSAHVKNSLWDMSTSIYIYISNEYTPSQGGITLSLIRIPASPIAGKKNRPDFKFACIRLPAREIKKTNETVL